MRSSASAPLLLLFFPLLFLACNNGSPRRALRLEDFQEWARPQYAIDGQILRQNIRDFTGRQRPTMYADRYAADYYGGDDCTTVWVTRNGVDAQADTLLAHIQGDSDLGLPVSAFSIDTLRALLRRVRQFDYEGTDANTLLAHVEYLLTRTYLRYACGQRFGFVHPRHVFNHLLIDPPPAGETSQAIVYRQLYDQGNEEVTDSFVRHALRQVALHRVGSFLHEVQPTDRLYGLMQEAWCRARQQGDTARARLARINMERARWRYPRPQGGRYIWVNLAAQELTAADTERDTTATMRVCCGNATHKTPLLHSAIRYVELNPYWVIPQTIVRKEIVPNHVGDSAYYARNNYHAINKETREEVDPASLTAGDLRSARYTLRQERGAGNSLGRIIFRFPNNFSVYLHDTNNPGAFQRANRAISHGCVRVERPLDLALFFLDKPSDFFIDRIRMAIDMPPTSPEGIRYREAHPDAEPLGSFSYPAAVPVWLDYWTLYPTPDGSLQSFADPYEYDKVIEKKLNDIN